MSHDAREYDATQTSEVSKYQIISQPKLDKLELQCYSKCSKWWPKFDHRRWNWCLHESAVCYQATRHTHVRCASN